MKTDFVFVSGNMRKVQWLEKFLGQKVEHHKLDLDELQSLDPEEVIRHKAAEAYRALGKSVLVEDTSLAFTALGKLPGPFIKFFLGEIGTEGICKLLDNFDDRSATSTVVYCYYDGKEFHVFRGDMVGQIRDKPKGSFGMGWDPIFMPDLQDKTYAEMDETTYKKHAVRGLAVAKLKMFLDE